MWLLLGTVEAKSTEFNLKIEDGLLPGDDVAPPVSPSRIDDRACSHQPPRSEYFLFCCEQCHSPRKQAIKRRNKTNRVRRGRNGQSDVIDKYFIFRNKVSALIDVSRPGDTNNRRTQASNLNFAAGQDAIVCARARCSCPFVSTPH